MQGIYDRPEKVETKVIRIREEEYNIIRGKLDPKREKSWVDIVKELVEKYNI